MADKKEGQYKLFTRLSASDRDMLDYLVFKTKKSRQDLIEPIITEAIHRLAKQQGYVAPVAEEADEGTTDEDGITHEPVDDATEPVQSVVRRVASAERPVYAYSRADAAKGKRDRVHEQQAAYSAG